MSRGVLIQCPTCKGKTTVAGTACPGCNRLGVASGSPAGAPDDEPAPPSHDHQLWMARSALKEAASNYAAALLLTHATADHVTRAFDNLEAAAARLTQVKQETP